MSAHDTPDQQLNTRDRTAAAPSMSDLLAAGAAARALCTPPADAPSPLREKPDHADRDAA
ncbi:hypothetical protein AB0M29_01570 [Streptomyces sp. NPDC051976]|uniref:hypothetical protein n=1 Tax=Streptomyces sp. NPDC051976 TaxID=3154947 RepID=UPI00341F0F40